MTQTPDRTALAGKKIGLLTASASRLGGGVFEAAVLQTRIIQMLGGTAEVFALHDDFSREDASRFAGAPVHHCSVVGPRQIGIAPPLARRLLAAELDCLHLNGIWMYPSMAAATWARATGRGYIISPHGMMDAWITSRGRLKKQLARWAYEHRSWSRATRFHALTAREASDIERETGRHDAVVIPNPGPNAGGAEASIRQPTFVYIGRIHAKKNLLALIQAWNVVARPAAARLVIAGWGDEDLIASIRRELSRGDGSATYVGPLYGTDKQALLDSASWIVLPSLSEGLPMAILESWAAGTPVIMTNQCNLPEGLAAGAALRCGYDAPAIEAALARACAMSDREWAAMSAASSALARTTFSFEAVSRHWSAVYSGLINPKTRRLL